MGNHLLHSDRNLRVITQERGEDLRPCSPPHIIEVHNSGNFDQLHILTSHQAKPHASHG